MDSPVAKRMKESSDIKNDDKDDTEVDENQLSPSPTLHYDILRIIFKLLKAKDLSSAACVSKLWNEAALEELNSRRNPEYILEEFATYKNKKEGYRAAQLAEDLRIKPYFGFVIKKTPNNQFTWKPRECFFRHLPASHNPLMIFSGYDVVVDNIDVGNEKQLAVFLPNIPDLEINRYDVPIDYRKSKIINKDMESRRGYKFITKVIDSENTNKCIIILNYNNDRDLELMISHFEESYEPGTVAVWGGMPTSLKTCSNLHSKESENLNQCLDSVSSSVIYLSSPSLLSWSVVLPKSCKSKEAMELRLQGFKEQIKLKKHSLALMSACCAREDNKMIEIQAFKTVFPDVALVGFHGGGEYGLNSLSKKRQTITHSYCTIFLILSYD